MLQRGLWLAVSLFVYPSGLMARSGSPTEVIKSRTHEGFVRIAFPDEALVHVQFGFGTIPDSPHIGTSPMIASLPVVPAPSQRHDQVIETGRLRLQVHPDNLCINVFDKKLALELTRMCPQDFHSNWKFLRIDSALRTNLYGLGQHFRGPGTSDGDLIGEDWDPGFHGMGNTLAPFAGGAVGKIMIPVLYALGTGTANYALMFDHPRKQHWVFPKSGWSVGTEGRSVSLFVLAGDSLAQLRRRYMSMTGHPPVPPREIFGLWVSRFGYESWGAVEAERLLLGERRLPVDGMMLDLQWFGGRFYPNGTDTRSSRMGTLQFDPVHFPNPAENITRLRDEHALRLGIIEEPYVSRFLPEHDDLARRGFLATECTTSQPVYLDYNPWWGVGGMIDWTNPAASRYWFETKRLPLIKMGLHMHWTDLGEPEMYSASSCYQGGGHREIHNLYNLKWSQSIAHGYADHAPDQRAFILSRSGTAGSQRYGVGFWSGDIAGNMASLAAQMNARLHVSLSGIDYYGSDVGGFHRQGDLSEHQTHELYTQWFANSALLDFPLRPHVWAVANGNTASPAVMGHVASNRFNLRRRYELFPYFYSLAHAAYRKGEPIVRPLVYEFQDDLVVREMGHQVMIGSSLLLGRVARYGERRRDVYLPRGHWLHLDRSQVWRSSGDWHGPFAEEIDGLFRLPLFVRQGAIIPRLVLSGAVQNLQQIFARRPLYRVLIYPSTEASSFDLFHDDGQSNAYRRGGFDQLRITQQVRSGKLHVNLEPMQKMATNPFDFAVELEIMSTAGEDLEVVVGGPKGLESVAIRHVQTRTL